MSICDSSQCTGRMACYNVCTKNYIKMEYESNGILSPVISINAQISNVFWLSNQKCV